MEKKIKLVFISRSELNQRMVDFFCLDELCKDFDLEYWDYTDFVYLPQCFDNKLNRPYLRKIHSLGELKQNLKRIPSDSIITLSINLCKKNRKALKAVSKHFPTIVLINFYVNTPSTIKVNKETPTSTSTWRRLLSFIKKPFYNTLFFRTLIKVLFHPHQYRFYVNRWQFGKELNRFEKVVWFSCDRNTKYFINHPDIEQFVCLNRATQKRCDRYIVYIDQYFPYHVDLKFHNPDMNQNQLAEEFFPSVNRYFGFLEKQYDCKVIIALHPMANYQGNPYGGREMCSLQTAALVRDSIGVCMHSSNALSFVMLFDKPVVSLINDAVRKVPRLNNQILNITEECNIQLVDTDMTPYEAQPMRKVDAEYRDAYISRFFGDLKTENLHSNAELFKEHYMDVYNCLRKGEASAKKNMVKKQF